MSLRLYWTDTRIRASCGQEVEERESLPLSDAGQYKRIQNHPLQPVMAIFSCKCGETLGRPTCHLEDVLVHLFLGSLGDLSFEHHQDLAFLFTCSYLYESLIELFVGYRVVFDWFPNLL